MVRGTDYLLQKHFSRSLADKNVADTGPVSAGTGTFVTSLIDYLPADRLEHKYRHEIHATPKWLYCPITSPNLN